MLHAGMFIKSYLVRKFPECQPRVYGEPVGQPVQVWHVTVLNNGNPAQETHMRYSDTSLTITDACKEVLRKAGYDPNEERNYDEHYE
jgi:hypothetical protein